MTTFNFASGVAADMQPGHEGALNDYFAELDAGTVTKISGTASLLKYRLGTSSVIVEFSGNFSSFPNTDYKTGGFISGITFKTTSGVLLMSAIGFPQEVFSLLFDGFTADGYAHLTPWADTVNGTAHDDWLTGGFGRDTLDGKAGADTLEGGKQSDTYIVDSSLDTIIEQVGEGWDRVQAGGGPAGTTYKLADNVEEMTLTGTLGTNAEGNNDVNVLRGNAAANALTGLGGDDFLDGKGGADTMTGGTGNDTYVVDNAADQVIELSDQGTDTVRTSITYPLPANVENLVLLGRAALNGTGNDLPNEIAGNSAANVLSGDGGNDVLAGGAGNDTLDGGSGADIMKGGLGSDRYVVDDPGDQIVEFPMEMQRLTTDAVWHGVSYIDGMYGQGPLISSDGRFVIFTSSDSGLVVGDTNDNGDVFLVDRGTGSTTRISTDASNAQVAVGAILGDSDITPDAHYAVFASPSAEYVSGDTNGNSDIFVKDLTAGTVTRVSTNSSGAESNADSVFPHISADGRYIVFSSTASNLVDGDTNGLSDIFVKDLVTGSIVRASTDEGGFQAFGTGGSFEPQITPDGRYVVFSSQAASLSPFDSNNASDVYVKDMLSGALTRVSATSTGTAANSASSAPQISADGHYVIFTSSATNLVAGDTNGVPDVFVKNLDTGAVTRVSTAAGGSDGSISGDGQYAVFVSAVRWGTSAHNGYVSEVFVKDLQTGTVAQVTHSLAPGYNGTAQPITSLHISEDGQWIVFSSDNPLLAGEWAFPTDYDVIVVSNPLLRGGGQIDTVQSSMSFSIADQPNLECVTLTGTAGIDATGNAAKNVLTGNSGANTLDGGVGADTLIGGAGNDTYIAEDTGDVISETLAAGGIDTVHASVNWTLGPNLENLILTGTSSINGTGNTLANSLTGNDADNVLDGKAGADTMTGHDGDDTYFVDNVGDIVTESAGEGTDAVNSTVTYTLADKPDVENLTLIGAAAINGTGNGAANILIGNAAGNQLIGNGGNDVLDGKGGGDTMTGGLGDDTYFVDNAADKVLESPGEGTDTVNSTITYTLAGKPDLENLTLIGTAAINGTGNDADNILTGNGAANVLDGGNGADTMIGGAGNDTYVVDNAGDVINETLAAGVDLVRSAITFTLADKFNLENVTLTGTGDIDARGDDEKNVLTGNAGANTLDGAGGADTLIGGAGNDTYVVGETADVISESLVAGGVDTVQAFVNWTLGANLENLVLSGTWPINGTGNTLANSLTGNDADNVLDGKAGADTMIGHDGDDTYFVDNVGDVVTESADEGTDTVNSMISYTLADKPNLENLTLLGASAINGTGNEAANTLTGNAAANQLTGNGGNDVFDGKGGGDTMTGGQGDDTYFVDNVADKVLESPGEGTDTVNSTITYTLADKPDLENLTLIGTAAINGTGNEVDNQLTGNSGANVLRGGGGVDHIDGGAGNDRLIGGTGSDVLTGGIGNDRFVFDALPASPDSVTDFVTGADKFEFDHLAFTAIGPAGAFSDAKFVSGVGAIAAVNADDRLIFNQSTGDLYYDPDGSGSADAALVATLGGGATLHASDVVIV